MLIFERKIDVLIKAVQSCLFLQILWLGIWYKYYSFLRASVGIENIYIYIFFLALRRSVVRTYMIRQVARKSVHKPSIPMSAIKAMPKDVRKDGRDHYYVGGYGRQQKMCLMPSRSASLTISSTSSSVSFSPIRWCRNSKMDYIWNV